MPSLVKPMLNFKSGTMQSEYAGTIASEFGLNRKKIGVNLLPIEPWLVPTPHSLALCCLRIKSRHFGGAPPSLNHAYWAFIGWYHQGHLIIFVFSILLFYFDKIRLFLGRFFQLDGDLTYLNYLLLECLANALPSGRMYNFSFSLRNAFCWITFLKVDPHVSTCYNRLMRRGESC